MRPDLDAEAADDVADAGCDEEDGAEDAEAGHVEEAEVDDDDADGEQQSTVSRESCARANKSQMKYSKSTTRKSKSS